MPERIDKLHRLNIAPLDEATAMILPFIERAPALAERAALEHRPFADVAALETALTSIINALDEDGFLLLARGHPLLAPPRAGDMTADSQSEQARLGLIGLDQASDARLADLNRQYLARHGFPFILALHRVQDLTEIFAAFTARLGNRREVEMEAARREIASVSASRVQRHFC